MVDNQEDFDDIIIKTHRVRWFCPKLVIRSITVATLYYLYQNSNLLQSQHGQIKAH